VNIEWVITKKRGIFRPVLRYTVTLTEFERELGVPMVRIASQIPKPPDASWDYCWPGQNERGQWSPAEFHQLATPAHKTGELSEVLRLPWREGNAYPEVEASFQALRQAFERALEAAAASAPLQLRGDLETTRETRRAIAPAFAAERLLRLVNPEAARG
jgi:hypothetical protein